MTASLYGVVVGEEVEDWGLFCALGGQELMREVHDAVDVAAGCRMGHGCACIGLYMWSCG